MVSLRSPKTRKIGIILLVLLLSAGTAAAVTIVVMNPNPISPGSGTLTGSSDLVLESQSLQYTGNNATAVDVAINNTAGSSHTVDVHVAVKDSTGTVVETKTNTGVSLPANTVTTETVTFDNELTVDSFSEIEVTVEQTS